MDIIGKKYIYFLISFLTIVPGLVSLLLFGLNLSIDFVGGSRFTFSFPEEVNQQVIQNVRNSFEQKRIEIATIQPSNRDIVVRTPPIDQKKHEALLTELRKKIKNVKEENYETVGPVIGQETTLKAVQALLLASVLIVLYIAWSFRKVPKPASSWRFGICAIAALVHDVLVVVGIFSLLGYFFKVEVDSLFVTALLTIIGFSVHDTIVVFDRIRENLRRMPGMEFATVVNDSIVQTMVRSLNTSFTTLLVLFTLLLFGGESTKWFVVALLIGIASGTYSSIFNAAPLLVVWEEWSGRAKRRSSPVLRP